MIASLLKGTGYAKRQADIAKITERTDNAIRISEENMKRLAVLQAHADLLRRQAG